MEKHPWDNVNPEKASYKITWRPWSNLYYSVFLWNKTSKDSLLLKILVWEVSTLETLYDATIVFIKYFSDLHTVSPAGSSSASSPRSECVFCSNMWFPVRRWNCFFPRKPPDTQTLGQQMLLYCYFLSLGPLYLRKAWTAQKLKLIPRSSKPTKIKARHPQQQMV